MMKLLGACMILWGCFGLGLWYRAQFVGRIKALRSMIAALELLMGEVRYGHATLPECCLHVARYLENPLSLAFEKAGRRMEENMGLSFGEVFEEEIKGLDMLPVKAEDKEVFMRFAMQTGFADSQMQIRILEQSRDMLRSTEEKLESENAEKCRLAVGLGAMSGLLLLLVLW